MKRERLKLQSFIMCACVLACVHHSNAQDSTLIPFRVEILGGWNHLKFPGINDDLKSVRDSVPYSTFDIPVGNFGNGKEIAVNITAPISEDLYIGFGVKYFQTRGYYSGFGSHFTLKSLSEIEYSFSRISPQAIFEYSHMSTGSITATLNVRLSIGISFVNLRKDFNFPSMITGDPFIVPLAIHITGKHDAVNPEFGGGIALGFGVFDNLRIKIGASWIISTSQTVGGSYNVAFREDVAEQYKAALYKDVNLAYSGISVSGGLEFGL